MDAHECSRLRGYIETGDLVQVIVTPNFLCSAGNPQHAEHALASYLGGGGMTPQECFANLAFCNWIW